MIGATRLIRTDRGFQRVPAYEQPPEPARPAMTNAEWFAREKPRGLLARVLGRAN